MYLLEFFV